MRRKFTDIVEFSGKACSSFDGKKSYISTGCVHDDHICKDEIEAVDYSSKPSRANLVVKPGDILFAKMQATKKTLLIDEDLSQNIYSTGFYAVKPKDGLITKKCLFYLINSSLFLDEKDKNCSGATQKAINNQGLSNIELNIPEFSMQESLTQKLDALSIIIEAKQSQIEYLDNLVKARFVEMFGMPGTDPFSYGIKELGKCCELNPKKAQDKRLTSNIDVSFIPMPSVSENGDIDPTDIRSYEEVKKGFTYFAENDVLFAKITPCMENGKGAVARGLKNGIGFGSTEFHVLRPIKDISNSYWIYVLTSFKSFRKDAEANMTGSAGQRRTPVSFLDNYKVALPPIYLQNQFAAFVAQVDKSKFAITRSLLYLTKIISDSFIPHSGQISVLLSSRDSAG